jgi:hypothetical protein
LIIHLLVPRLEPVEDIDRVPAHAFSLGTIVGFGFVGGIFGSFTGWSVGILSRALGSGLLKYMAIGAIIGVVTGVISGVAITSSAIARNSKFSN